MTVGAASDIGRARERNEDSYMIMHSRTNLPNVFAVADGMGGHSSGETASKLAIDHVKEYIKANPSSFINESDISESLTTMMKNTNKLVIECSETSDEWRGMGTTLTVSIISGNKLYIGHVGDSRVYIISGDEMTKVTVDHSYIEELVITGKITREQARNHPERNIITRAIGGVSDVIADTYVYDLKHGDYVIMCTDGLTNEVDESVILETINSCDTPQNACDKLIKKANDNGGKDNITVIVMRYLDDRQASEQ